MSKKCHNTAIAQAMEFTSNDLIHNRRGELSEVQTQKLDVMRDMFVGDIQDAPLLHIPSIIILGIIGAVAVILHFMGIFNRLQQWLGALCLPLLIGGSLCILGWFLWAQFRYWAVRKLLPDMIDDMIQAPPLYSITGEANHSIEEPPDETSCWLDIGNERFPLTTNAAGVFQRGNIYRIFYVNFADATVLMSAELLKESRKMTE